MQLYSVPDIQVIDLDADQQGPAPPPQPEVQPPPIPVQQPPAQVLPQPAAQPTPTPPTRGGRRRRGSTIAAPTPARRSRSNATEGENSRGTRPSRSSARYAFYGNGDSNDDFVDL